MIWFKVVRATLSFYWARRITETAMVMYERRSLHISSWRWWRVSQNLYMHWWNNGTPNLSASIVAGDERRVIVRTTVVRRTQCLHATSARNIIIMNHRTANQMPLTSLGYLYKYWLFRISTPYIEWFCEPTALLCWLASL